MRGFSISRILITFLTSFSLVACSSSTDAPPPTGVILNVTRVRAQEIILPPSHYTTLQETAPVMPPSPPDDRDTCEKSWSMLDGPGGGNSLSGVNDGRAVLVVIAVALTAEITLRSSKLVYCSSYDPNAPKKPHASSPPTPTRPASKIVESWEYMVRLSDGRIIHLLQVPQEFIEIDMAMLRPKVGETVRIYQHNFWQRFTPKAPASCVIPTVHGAFDLEPSPWFDIVDCRFTALGPMQP